jgi:hypothetical protein
MNNEPFNVGAKMILVGLKIMIKSALRGLNHSIVKYPYAFIIATVFIASIAVIKNSVDNRTERDYANKKYIQLKMKYDSIVAAYSCSYAKK